ncbi:hypothetical protein SESBI_48269 [Sesbania bispinosa]|nr:hypothetical protein SESBI_48269 [Sesbania bispinosa]
MKLRTPFQQRELPGESKTPEGVMTDPFSRGREYNLKEIVLYGILFSPPSIHPQKTPSVSKSLRIFQSPSLRLSL